MGIAKDKLNDEQKKEIERLRNFVSRNRLNPRMNSTKWRAAIDAVAAVEGYAPVFRVKCIDGGEPPVAWSDAFPKGIPLYNAVEWLELNPVSGRKDFRAALRSALEKAGVPVAETPGGVRIIGYDRPGRN